MLALTPTQIKEITERIDCGECCYYHKQKGSWIFTPDFDNNIYADEEFYADELEELENNFANYIKIEPLPPSDSFKIMADFTNSLPETLGLRNQLIFALSNRKPFRQFKFLIDRSGVYREQWFAFKSEQLRQWVIDRFQEEIMDGENGSS